MTVADAMESATVALTRDHARALTDEVRGDVRALWAKVLTLYEGGAHTALGYGSWKLYWEAEFGQAGSRGEQLVRAGRVVRVLNDADVEVLPANDLVARALVPVLRAAPAELPAVWLRALNAVGRQPYAREVRELAEPYRVRGPRRRAKAADVTAGQTRRLRNLVAMPIMNVHASAEAASGNVAAALSTMPEEDTVRDWLDHAERARVMLTATIRELRRHLPDANDDQERNG
jgi:hypothetical protein